jgi:SH3 domain-containing YSC84-like protein 1
MKNTCAILGFAVLVTTFAFAADASKILNAAAQVVQKMASSNQIPSGVLKQASCVAVIPKMTKAGFIVGGKHGNGAVSCRTSSGWSAPAFISMTGASVGLQAGAAEQDIVLLMNDQGKQELEGGHWDLGAEAVATGPTGETASSTSTGWKAPVLSYSNAGGAFAGFDVGGSKLGLDEDTIKNTYGGSGSIAAILDGQVQPTDAAGPFLSALHQAAGR